QIVHSVSGSGTSARLPASSFFTLPSTGAYVIEVSSTSSLKTGAYHVALADAPDPYPVQGIVTGGGMRLAGVTMTFSLVLGSGPVPPPVQTDVAGSWSQTGFGVGATYRVTPSLGTLTFTPASRDLARKSDVYGTGAFLGCRRPGGHPSDVG